MTTSTLIWEGKELRDQTAFQANLLLVTQWRVCCACGEYRPQKYMHRDSLDPVSTLFDPLAYSIVFFTMSSSFPHVPFSMLDDTTDIIPRSARLRIHLRTMAYAIAFGRQRPRNVCRISSRFKISPVCTLRYLSLSFLCLNSLSLSHTHTSLSLHFSFLSFTSHTHSLSFLSFFLKRQSPIADTRTKSPQPLQRRPTHRRRHIRVCRFVYIPDNRQDDRWLGIISHTTHTHTSQQKQTNSKSRYT